MKNDCCYLLWINNKNTPCGKPTKYKMVRDDDETLRRKYDAFCPEHRKIVDSTPFDIDDDEYDAEELI